MDKKNIVVLFGGQSSEHEVSCVSAVTVIRNIDEVKYDVIKIGITKEGKWLLVDSIDDIDSGEWREGKIGAIISPDATKKAVYFIDETGKMALRQRHIDVIFPVLHGLYGEDGTVQGLFELAKIPYVGCGVLSSAVSMDKLYTKIIVDTLGIRQAKYLGIHKRDLADMGSITAEVEKQFSYPVFIKPSCAGSSKGVSKAKDREQLINGIREAFNHDSKVLVEETIIGREVECGIFADKDVKASGVGEIIAAADFYDYEAKYHNAESKTDVHPNFAAGKEDEIRNDAIAIFKAIDGNGLARVDFFLTPDNEVVFNEINTLPGFTSISMYPMLWQARGIDLKDLVEKLIQTAFDR